MKGIDAKLFKLLKQKRYTRGELSEMLDVPQKDILATLRALEETGVSITLRSPNNSNKPLQVFPTYQGLLTP